MIDFDANLKELGLDTKCYNAIKRYFCSDKDITIKDACSLTTKQISELRNIGEKGIKNIIRIFHFNGFYFADEERVEDLVSSGQQIYDLQTRKVLVNKRILALKNELNKLELLNHEIDLAMEIIEKKQKGATK